MCKQKYAANLRTLQSLWPNRRLWRFNQGCGVRVAKGRRCLSGARFLTTRGVGYGFFCPTPTLEVQLDQFFASHSKVGNSCWNGTITYETFVETENSCFVPRFPMSVRCCNILNCQNSFTLCEGVGVGNFGKIGVWHFVKLGVSVGHFICDSATVDLIMSVLRKDRKPRLEGLCICCIIVVCSAAAWRLKSIHVLWGV